jgi:pilus assembly protein FimV
MAIGIGDMTVRSYINQPFQADIAVLQPDGLLESEVIASLDNAEPEVEASDDTLDISLDLEFQEAAKPAPEDAEADASGALDAEDPAETALDLALAYIDMGDKAGAADLLQTVLSSGDEAQREHAQLLLDSLE